MSAKPQHTAKPAAVVCATTSHSGDGRDGDRQAVAEKREHADVQGDADARAEHRAEHAERTGLREVDGEREIARDSRGSAGSPPSARAG